MEPERAVLPELDRERLQAVAGPIRWSWNRSNGELGCHECDRFLEGMAALERRRLFAGPGADLSETRPGSEIGVGLRVRHPLDGAAQPHLPVGGLPVKEQSA